MTELRKTQDALRDLASNRPFGAGDHFGFQPMSTEAGVFVDEVPYDETEGHLPTDIDLFSAKELLTGEPHVEQVLADRPLGTRTIVHHDSLSRDDPRVIAMKLSLARSLQTAIEYSLPSNNDGQQAVHDVMSSTLEERDVGRSARLVKVTDDPLETAHKIAKDCGEDLTFIISDFKRLPLEAVGGIDYSSTVAVKVNHIAEMALPAGNVIIRVGKEAEVNTGDPEELADFNAELAGRHQTAIQRLQDAGIAVAQVVFDRKSCPKFGFDVTATDRQLAAAIRSREA